MYWNKCWLELLAAASILNGVLSSPVSIRDRSLSKRVERVPDDATKWSKVLDWMEEVGIQEENLVFYSGGKQQDALDFCDANPDYAYFWDIFDEDFQKDFGDVSMTDSAVTKACSLAMASHAMGDVRVFGDAAGGDDGLWKSIEKPLLMKDVSITHIWSMKDGTKDPNDHPDGDLKAGGNSLPTKALNILGQYVPGAKTFDWLFLETDYGHGVECRTDFLIPFKTVPWATGGAVTYPGGTWDLVINEQPCQYKNSGDNAGKLFCGDKEHWCMDDPAEKNEYQCPGGYTRQPVFTCPY